MDALIMAGGASQRMRRSGNPTHKALISVAGMPMIERNLRYVASAGCKVITIAVGRQELELIGYVENVAPALVGEMGITCRILIEQSPLGTIGAVREVEFRDNLLVLNVDNLTSISLVDFMEYHTRQSADFTVAAHRHALSLEFGELVLRDGLVIDYREKPVTYPLVSSGLYAISSRAVELIAKNEKLDVPSFFVRVRSQGMRILAFEHNAPWIDVNDRDALDKAEAMLR